MLLYLALTVSLLWACCLADDDVSYNGYKVLRVQVNDRKSGEILHQYFQSDQFWAEAPGKFSDILVSPTKFIETKQRLKMLGMAFNEIIQNVDDLMRLERMEAPGRQDILPSSEHPMTWTKYHSFNDIDAYMDYLQRKYSDIVSLQYIGRSNRGRKMRILKICKDRCGTKPAMYMDATTHAREWITPAVATFLMRQLVEVENSTSDLITKLDWYILPFVNPDGYEFTRKSDRLWRKTRSINPGYNCIGTDPNRNWDIHFGEEGAHSDPCSGIYHGRRPFSEIENRNVKNFIWTRRQQIKFFNTIHSYSQLILLPFGFTKDKYPRYEQLKNFAKKANEDLRAVHDKCYEVETIADSLYLASGSSLDWVFVVANISYPIAMELRDTGKYGFLLPPDQIIPNGEEAWAFHQNAARQIIEEFGGQKFRFDN